MYMGVSTSRPTSPHVYRKLGVHRPELATRLHHGSRATT